MRKAFTLIEIIMVLVIIGILAGVAIPKFSKLSSNSKVASELATASTIQSAIDDAHSEWIISEGSFTWGSQTSDCTSGSSSNFNCSEGYPQQLGDCPPAFNQILKSSSIVDAKWTCSDNGDGVYEYEGPASQDSSGVDSSSEGKPDASKHWEYNNTSGLFTLEDDNTFSLPNIGSIIK